MILLDAVSKEQVRHWDKPDAVAAAVTAAFAAVVAEAAQRKHKCEFIDTPPTTPPRSLRM